jgi:hypothetical protein
LNLLGLVRPASAAAGAVFVSSISAPAVAAGDAPRLGNATGIIGPVWRSRAAGVDGAPLVGFARGAGGALSLRAIDPASGRLQDLGVQLAPEVARGANAVGIRWDLVHARALFLARTSAAGGEGAIDAWLVDFSPAPADARS